MLKYHKKIQNIKSFDYYVSMVKNKAILGKSTNCETLANNLLKT